MCVPNFNPTGYILFQNTIKLLVKHKMAGYLFNMIGPMLIPRNYRPSQYSTWMNIFRESSGTQLTQSFQTTYIPKLYDNSEP